MKDHIARLREQALAKEHARQNQRSAAKPARSLQEEKSSREAAGFLGVPEELIISCCGSICAHCEVFLDKAIALAELGYPHHLFMNSSQEEKFLEALEIFRRNKAEYQTRRQELMDRMRR